SETRSSDTRWCGSPTTNRSSGPSGTAARSIRHWVGCRSWDSSTTTWQKSGSPRSRTCAASAASCGGGPHALDPHGAHVAAHGLPHLAAVLGRQVLHPAAALAPDVVGQG